MSGLYTQKVTDLIFMTVLGPGVNQRVQSFSYVLTCMLKFIFDPYDHWSNHSLSLFSLSLKYKIEVLQWKDNLFLLYEDNDIYIVLNWAWVSIVSIQISAGGQKY